MEINIVSNQSKQNFSERISRNHPDDIELEKKRLYKISKEMESLFLYQVLKAMRKSIPEMDKEKRLGLGGGMGKDVYMQMFDQELAVRMAGINDKSIASIIYNSLEKALEKQLGVEDKEPSGTKGILPAKRYIKIRADDISALPVRAGSMDAVGSDNRLPRYGHIIREVSQKYRLNPALIESVIIAESNGDPTAVSRANAKGLMQLTDTTATEMGVRDIFNPEENIEGGARYLRHLIDRFGDIKKALAAYNAGPEAVKRYGGVPPYPETKQYIRTVLSAVGGKQLFY